MDEIGGSFLVRVKYRGKVALFIPDLQNFMSTFSKDCKVAWVELYPVLSINEVVEMVCSKRSAQQAKTYLEQVGLATRDAVRFMRKVNRNTRLC